MKQSPARPGQAQPASAAAFMVRKPVVLLEPQRWYAPQHLSQQVLAPSCMLLEAELLRHTHRLRAGDDGSMVRSDASRMVDRLLSKTSRPRPTVTPPRWSSTIDSILEPGSSQPQTGALSRCSKARLLGVRGGLSGLAGSAASGLCRGGAAKALVRMLSRGTGLGNKGTASSAAVLRTASV